MQPVISQQYSLMSTKRRCTFAQTRLIKKSIFCHLSRKSDKTCLIIEGKLKRGHIFAIQQATHSSASAPPLTLHAPQLEPRYTR